MPTVISKQFGIVTLLPAMFDALNAGVIGRAQTQGQLNLSFYNPRDYADNPNGYIDDKPYGGGPGMVLEVKPVRSAIQAAKKTLGTSTPVIALSPQGKPLTQSGVEKLAKPGPFILLCGRYEGIDERVIQHDVDDEWSIGDYVISGGELAAMVLIDAITRMMPGVLGDDASTLDESFHQGLLDYPHYTRPQTYDNQSVPDVLLGGDHRAIMTWRHQQALGQTWLKRPDLLEKRVLSLEEQTLLAEFKRTMQGETA